MGLYAPGSVIWETTNAVKVLVKTRQTKLSAIWTRKQAHAIPNRGAYRGALLRSHRTAR